MKGDDVGDQADELDRGQRTVRVVVAAPVLGLLLWFVGVPVLGAIIDERAAEISDQLGEQPHSPCERVVKVGGVEHLVRIKPYTGGTLAV
ncbi:MAG TPA: hypothetical protein VKC17_07640, partial [Sphingomicrobium sp.]|nr:hypothetical protein [Sphingomicrobium sp.]